MAETEIAGQPATLSLETSAALTVAAVSQLRSEVAKLDDKIEAHENDSKTRIRNAALSTIGIGAIGVAALITVMIYMGNITNDNILDVRLDNRAMRTDIRELTVAIAELKSAVASFHNRGAGLLGNDHQRAAANTNRPGERPN